MPKSISISQSFLWARFLLVKRWLLLRYNVPLNEIKKFESDSSDSTRNNNL
jgi:hypothetical protein